MATTLRARWPKFDFDEAGIVWSRSPECAMVWNAMSTCAPIVEPWLNRVMMLCKKRLPDERLDLRGEIDDFIRQEANHYRMHIEFNRRIEKAGYCIPEDDDEEFREELRDLLRNKSLAFNAAYCAGFENFTLFTSKFMFEEAGDLFRQGDLGGADMWLWHMAEEYEHRSVCHDVFAAVSGNYFVRIYGLIYSFIHLNGRIAGRTRAFLEKYRENMTDEERALSVKRAKAYNRRYLLYALPRMLAILLPFYNPAKSKASPQLRQALERYGAMSA